MNYTNTPNVTFINIPGKGTFTIRNEDIDALVAWIKTRALNTGSSLLPHEGKVSNDIDGRSFLFEDTL